MEEGGGKVWTREIRWEEHPVLQKSHFQSSQLLGVSLLGNSNAFKNKNGESEGGKKGIEGRQGTAWVVPGPFRGRRTWALILSGLLGCVVTGESRTRILSPSLKEGE